MSALRTFLAAAWVAVASLVMASPAAAATVVGGTTAVTLTSAPVLTGAGLSFTTTGSATASTNSAGLPVVIFPITGGSINDQTMAAIFQHDGSGLRFSNTAGAFLNIGNFVIDTAAARVTGLASANGGAGSIVTLFNLGSGGTLLLSSDAAGAFSQVFGVNLAAGTQIGTAVITPRVAAVPEPATWLTMLLGVAVVGGVMRRKRGTLAIA